MKDLKLKKEEKGVRLDDQKVFSYNRSLDQTFERCFFLFNKQYKSNKSIKL